MMAVHRAPFPLRMKLFGSVEVEIRSEPLPTLRSRKELWLLALLALQRGRPVTRAWLAQTLWPFPDHAADQAAYNLRRGLTNLRKALGPEAERIQPAASGSLFLDLRDASVDALAFDEAVARGDTASLEAAVSLYSGPLLLECVEPWAAVERARYEHEALRVLSLLGARAETNGDYETALSHLRRALAMDPLCEPAQRCLMETLQRSGDTSAALNSYQEFSRRLHRDRNAFPATETTALYHMLRAELRSRAGTHGVATQSAPAPRPPIHRLPVPLSPLIGREEEAREIETRFRLLRLLTLTGAGGVGKTRLAIHLADEIAPEFRDGVCFVDLAALTDPTQVGQVTAAALDLPEAREDPVLRTLTDYLRTRQLLLILDNCEHLIDSCAQLAGALLQGCRSVRILATSRQSLGIPGEGVWRVASLSLPDPARLPSDDTAIVPLLDRYSAVQLFVERARQTEANFVLTERNARAVARICVQLEGIPLALELAAARVKALPVEQIAERLDDRFRLLTEGPRTALSRQQTLEATIKWSFDLLAESDGDLLRALAVFAGGWTLEVAEAVGTDIGLTGDAALNILAHLVDRSLVIHETERGRYRFLETVRQYSCEKWMDERELNRAAERHLRIVLKIAEEAEPHLQGLDQAIWFGRLERERDNLRAALDWTATQHVCAEKGLRLAVALWRFWHRRGYLGLGRRYLANALEQTQALGATQSRAEAMIGAGMLAFFQGDTGAARQQFEGSLALSAALEDDHLRANALHSLGQMTWNQGAYEEARAHFTEVLALQRQYMDRKQIAVTLNYLGVVASDAGDHDAARQFFEESLDTGRDLNDRRLIANALHGLAHMAFYLDDFAAARRCYSEELSLARSLQDRELAARTLHRLGCVEQAMKDYAAARRLFEESLFAAEELAYRDLESAVLHSLGSTACAQEDYITARACFEQRLAISEDRGDKPGISYTLDAFAGMLVAQKQDERAVTLFAAAQALRQSLAMPSPINQAEYPRLQEARAALGEESFARAWGVGRVMTPDEAMAYARQKL